MPVRGRPLWAGKAVDAFLAQSYPNKELVILQDEDDPSFGDDFKAADNVHICGIFERWSIPKKRNECCRVSDGEIIVHWDSDDWSDSNRITEQVQRLEESGKAVTGYYGLLFHEEETGKAFKYSYKSCWALGTSLCYLKSWWQRHPFPESKAIGEDNAFVKEAHLANQLITTDGESMIVARIHQDNTSKKYTHGMQYRPVPMDQVPSGFFQ